LRIIIACILTFSLALSSSAQSSEPLSGETKSITASDGTFSFDVPIEWNVQNLLDLYITSPADSDLLELVIEEPTDDSLFIALLQINATGMFNGIELTDQMSFDEALQTFITAYNESNEDRGWTLFNPIQSIDTFGNPRAMIDLTDEDGSIGRVYLRTYGDNQYFAMFVSAKAETLTTYADTIEAIEASIDFEVSESSELELRLLWQTPLDMYMALGQVTVDDNYIYVSDDGDFIKYFTHEGEYVGDIDIGIEYFALDIVATGGGTIWINDLVNQMLWHVTRDGEILSSIEIDAHLEFVDRDSSGNIYIAVHDSESSDIYIEVFQPDGLQITRFHVVDAYTAISEFTMFDDVIYVDVAGYDVRGFKTDGTRVNNLLLYMTSQMTERRRFAPIGDNRFVLTIPSWQNPGTMALFLFDGSGNILGIFNLHESITGFRFMERILPDPQLGFVDFAGLGMNKFVMLANGDGEGTLYAFEIVNSSR